MSSDTGQLETKLNRLAYSLPEGLLADSSWFERHGFSRQLRHHYVAQRWLETVARGVYRRPSASVEGGSDPKIGWEQVVASLQLVLQLPIVVSGRSALDLQGYAHYLSAQGPKEVHLSGAGKPPSWLQSLPLSVRFAFHNSATLFNTPIPENVAAAARHGRAPWFVLGTGGSVPLTLSAPERAILEVIADVPDRESFHQASMLMEGLSTLNPRRLSALLRDCRSVKTKRLFFVLAERHNHPWLKHLDRAGVDLGSGKRVLGKGGKMDPTYLITLPEDFDGDH